MSEQPTIINGIPVDAATFTEGVFAWNVIGQSGLAEQQPGTHYNANRVCFNIGMQCEELAEQIKAVMAGAVDQGTRLSLESLHTTLKAYGDTFKGGGFYGAVLRADREELLDGSIDSAWVALNTLFFQTPHWREALHTVLVANANKFPNGNVVRDGNGKIVKPVGWTKPNLLPFVDQPID